MARPQDKNLKAFGSGALTPEEERAIRSAGGKASQIAKKKKKAMAELMKIYADMPSSNKKITKQLKNMGFEAEDLTQRLEIVDAVMKRAKKGDFYMVQMFAEMTGELGKANTHENNLLEAIQASTCGEVDLSAIPELQLEADSNADVVE